MHEINPARVGWDERSESQQIHAMCWVSFLNPAYRTAGLYVMGISKYDTLAGELQRGVRDDETKQRDLGVADYDSVQVRQAIVHTRQDLVLVVSHLSSLNKQIAVIRNLLWLIAFLLIISLISRYF